ncbi:MAG: single-stranded-DNA-specific exonuclease RecJ [Lamprobacter sp.]|nr:single-stranded-DNA-specific exonuclease RecJ [Lamprobacter sp.]MEA3639073.1 single-stranded-DNA-specific exonuclease RecJ [Lamprobacter sp.]
MHRLDHLLQRLYRHRGLDGELDHRLSALHPVNQLLGIDAAAALLADDIQAQRQLIIVGDYDADGATGTAVALLGLRALGAGPLDSLVPSRFAQGYGLSPAVVDLAAERRPDLIITVDNGIASHAGLERARALGLPVLITDHHLPGAELPEAAALVNPNQPGCPFPSKHLAGVGVMFYLLIATRAELRRRGWFQGHRQEPNLAELLDLVALGTVADVVTLDANNRILVEQGLRRIRAGHCRPGLRALLEIAGVDLTRTSARDLAFAAAPRLNAAGRLEDMSAGIACLVTDKPIEAMHLAQRLQALNQERRALTHSMGLDAERLLAEILAEQARDAPSGGLQAGLCLFAEDWHEGVIGILAARVRERCQRPVIAFAVGGDGLLKGSARSIEGLHLRDCLAAVDHAHPGLITRFGGHAMAAGLSLPREALEPFKQAFAGAVSAALGPDPATPVLHSDGALGPALLSLPTAEALRLAAPWGKGFSEPLFDGEFAISAPRLLKDRHLKLRVRPAQGPPIEAIGFNLADQHPRGATQARIAYRLEVNDYRGLRSPQLLIEQLVPLAG